MDRKTRLKIQNLSYTLAIILSIGYYLSYASILNITPQNTMLAALIAGGIAIAFDPTREILEIILGKAMGFSPADFLKRYQTDHPIERRIHRLVKEHIPHLHCPCDVIIKAPLPEEYSPKLLSIIEEAIQNTAQHSVAARADVNLFVNDERIALFVQDDGQGFTPFSLTESQQGLTKIKRLASRMGGTHRMETGEDGTAHWIDIPLTRHSFN